MTRKYDWTAWDREEITDPDRMLEVLDGFEMVGKAIKDIRLLGYAFLIFDEGLYKDETYSRYFDVDEPVIITLEDGDRFEIDYWFNTCKTGLNTLPDNVVTYFSNNLDGNVILSNCLGEKITGYTVSYFDVDDRLYIEDIRIELTNDKSLIFLASHDFFTVYTEESGEIPSITGEELRKGVPESVWDD